MTLAVIDQSCPWCRCRRWCASVGARAGALSRWGLLLGVGASISLVLALVAAVVWPRGASKAKAEQTPTATATAIATPGTRLPGGLIEFGPRSAAPAAPALVKAPPAAKSSSAQTPAAVVVRAIAPSSKSTSSTQRWSAAGAALTPTVAAAPTAPAPTPAAAAAATAAPAHLNPAILRPGMDCFTFVTKQPALIRADFDSAGLKQMLDPAALEDRARARASGARLKKLQARLDEYDQRIRRSAAETVARIESSGASTAAKTAALAAVRSSGGQLVRDALNFVTLQRQILTQTEAIVRFMRSRADRFTVENHRLLFADLHDRDEYDRLRTKLAELKSRQDQILNGMRKRGEEAIAALQDGGRIGGAREASASIAP